MAEVRARLSLVKPRLAAPFVVLALLAAACASDGGDTDSTSSDADSSDVETTVADEAEPADSAPSTQASADSTDAPAPGADAGSAGMTVTPSEYIGLAALVSVSADEPVQVEVTAVSGDHVVEVPRTAAVAETHDIPLVGMRAEQTYEITAEYFNEAGEPIGEADGAEFTTDALPPYFEEHELTIDEERAAPGYTIIEFDTLRFPKAHRRAST